MRRGTTPTITISTEVDLSEASNLFITFCQAGTVLFEKTLDDGITVTSDSVTIHLSQKETLSLSEKHAVEFQIRATIGEEKLASNVMKTTAETILKQGEI